MEKPRDCSRFRRRFTERPSESGVSRKLKRRSGCRTAFSDGLSFRLQSALLSVWGNRMIQTLIDFVLHVDVHLAELAAQYGAWIYGLLFLIVFCETGLVVTPFLPGDSLLFAAGGIAAVGGMDIHLMMLLLFAAAVLGDAVNFAVGKYFGAKLFANPDSKIFRQSHLAKTHAFYEKYGGKTIIIARFVPIVRTFAPFVAGMADMHYGRFIRYNIIGAALWVMLFSYAGYFFANTEIVRKNMSLVLAGIIAVSLLPMAVEIIRAKRAGER
ncbi:DedA family membrane protein [Neisseria bacilliformis ATCC BAA-1200]|uniref:DedA family membrane protein n=2 Tax=Neisseria TaxID=482 RepID=F2BCG5_9NEIS|nr:DedA family membrane protein [Neisseria bacilliformis ATCC BAA-1200]